MARPKGSNKDRQPIFKEEFQKLLILTQRSKKIAPKTKKKLLRAYTLLFYSGCRISEISSFTLEDISFLIKNKTFVLEDTKVNKDQLIRFNQYAVEQIAALDFSDCKEAIFYKNGSSSSMASSSLEKLVNKHLAMFLNDLYTTHSFRAGYITSLYEASGNPEVARKAARHSSMKTTLGYLTATNNQISQGLDKLFN